MNLSHMKFGVKYIYNVLIGVQTLFSNILVGAKCKNCEIAARNDLPIVIEFVAQNVYHLIRCYGK